MFRIVFCATLVLPAVRGLSAQVPEAANALPPAGVVVMRPSVDLYAHDLNSLAADNASRPTAATWNIADSSASHAPAHYVRKGAITGGLIGVTLGAIVGKRISLMVTNGALAGAVGAGIGVLVGLAYSTVSGR